MSLKEKLQQEQQFIKAKEDQKDQNKLIEGLKKLEGEKKLLLEKRQRLLDAEANLHTAYQQAGERSQEFLKTSKDLDDIMESYSDVMKDKGISNKGDLLNHSDFLKEKEVKDYKDTGIKRRESVAKISHLKETHFKGVVTRGGKKEGEELSPREKMFSSLQHEIAILDGEIVILENKEKELLGNINEEPRELLKKLCREESKDLSINLGVFDFQINDKPGFAVSFELVEKGDKYGREIAQDILFEKLQQYYYGQHINHQQAEDLKKVINTRWLSSEAHKKFEYSNDYSMVRNYLEKNQALKRFLNNSIKGVLRALDPETILSIKSRDGYLESIENKSAEDKLSESHKERREVEKEIEALTKDIQQKLGKSAYNPSIFTSKLKTEKAKLKIDFYKEAAEAFRHNRNPLENKALWEKARKLISQEALDKSEAEKIQKMATQINDCLKNEKMFHENYSLVGRYFDKNEIPKSFFEKDFFSSKEISISDFIKTVQNKQEEVQEELQKGDFPDRANELKKVFKEYFFACQESQKITFRLTNLSAHERLVSSFFEMFGRDNEV